MKYNNSKKGSSLTTATTEKKTNGYTLFFGIFALVCLFTAYRLYGTSLIGPKYRLNVDVGSVADTVASDKSTSKSEATPSSSSSSATELSLAVSQESHTESSTGSRAAAKSNLRLEQLSAGAARVEILSEISEPSLLSSLTAGEAKVW